MQFSQGLLANLDQDFFKVFGTGFSVFKADLASGFSVFRQDLASGFSVFGKVLAFCRGKKIEFLKATFSIKSVYVKMPFSQGLLANLDQDFLKVFGTGFSVVKKDLASGFSVFRQDLASLARF